MPRYGGRSKGCLTCRQRRVKCDEGQPECLRCIRAGRSCPGAAEGNVFINFSTSTQVEISSSSSSSSSTPATFGLAPPIDPCRPKAASEPTRSASPLIHCQSPGGADIEAEDDPPVANTNRAAHIHSTDTAVIAVSMKQLDQWTLPSWYQPSKTDLFQQHFTAHFIGNFFNPAAYLTNQNIWAFHLPAVQTSTISPAVKCAIKCATMAFYGTRADNTAMKTEACRWYIKGVQYQRLELEGTSIHGGARNLDVTSVLAPLMFSIFETIMVTSPSGWVQHTHAAIHFLEMIGPQAFQEGLPHSLLRSVRLSAVFCAPSWDAPPVIASQEWCTIPFQIYGKTAYDLLDDIFLQEPSIMILARKYKSLLADGMAQRAEALSTQVNTACRTILDNLDTWWLQHSEAMKDGSAGEYTSPPSSPWHSHPPYLETHTEGPKGPTSNFVIPQTFSDTYHASSVAKFNSICIIVFSVLRGMSNTPIHGAEITVHGDSILSATRYHERAGVAHTGSISMLHQLMVLYYQAVNKRQREAAKAAVIRWGKPRGVGRFVEQTFDKTVKQPY